MNVILKLLVRLLLREEGPCCQPAAALSSLRERGGRGQSSGRACSDPIIIQIKSRDTTEPYPRQEEGPTISTFKKSEPSKKPDLGNRKRGSSCIRTSRQERQPRRKRAPFKL